MIIPNSLQSRLQLLTMTTEDILAASARGSLRPPPFQRLWRWKPDDVRKLFDSIVSGFPVGNLLLWSRPAPAGEVRFGDDRYGLTVTVPAHPSAGYIVDGLQRITSIVATLQHLEDIGARDPDDPFRLFLDLEAREFVHDRGRQVVPSHWLPVSVLGDTLRILDWQASYPATASSREHIRIAHAFAKTIREYRWPVYIVPDLDDALVRTIFERINTSGRQLTVGELFQGLYGAQAERPMDLVTLRGKLTAHGRGQIEDGWLLKVLVALGDGDLSRSREHLRRPDAMSEAMGIAEPILTAVLRFLIEDADVPHLHLLPHRTPIVVLARLFKTHEQLSPDQRALLSAWLWRGALTRAHQNTTAALREALDAVRASDLEGTLTGLWRQVATPHDDYDPFDRYDFRKATTKLGCNALVSLDPVVLHDGRRIVISSHLESEGAGAFRLIVPSLRHLPTDITPDQRGLFFSLANRMFHPFEHGTSPWSTLTEIADRWVGHTMDPTLAARLWTHGITLPALHALRHRDALGFLQERRRVLEPLVRAWVESRTQPPKSPPTVNKRGARIPL